MASQTRLGRNIQAPARLADEQQQQRQQQRREGEERRRARRGGRREGQIREQHPALAPGHEEEADAADGVHGQDGGDEELMIENEDNEEVEIGEEEEDEDEGVGNEEEEQDREDDIEYGDLLGRSPQICTVTNFSGDFLIFPVWCLSLCF